MDIKNNNQEIIALSHDLNAEEYQLWHILLINAYEEFYKKEEHQIPVAKLLTYWSHEKNEDDLKQSLRRLALQIKYTLFNNHKKILGFFVLLSSIEIYKGICYYSYARKFKEFSHNPTMAPYLTRWGLQYSSQLVNLIPSLSSEKRALCPHIRSPIYN